MKMYSIQANGVMSGGSNQCSFTFTTPNLNNPVLCYFWLFASGLDSTTSVYFQPIAYAFLGPNAGTVPITSPLQNASLFFGSGINNNGRYITASYLLPWIGELNLPASSTWLVSLIAGSTVSTGNFSCTFWVQLGFLE
jgi:hypothetical protein